MPIEKGFIKCTVCDAHATVLEAEGKRSGKLYVSCPNCGTDQSNKPIRQAYIIKHMVSDEKDLEIQQLEHVGEVVLDMPSDTTGIVLDVISDIDNKAQEKAEVEGSVFKSLGIGLCVGLFIVTGFKVSGVLR